MNGPQQTAMSRKELRQNWKQKNFLDNCMPVNMRWGTRHAQNFEITEACTGNQQLFFLPSCEKPLQDND